MRIRHIDFEDKTVNFEHEALALPPVEIASNGTTHVIDTVLMPK